MGNLRIIGAQRKLIAVFQELEFCMNLVWLLTYGELRMGVWFLRFCEGMVLPTPLNLLQVDGVSIIHYIQQYKDRCFNPSPCSDCVPVALCLFSSKIAFLKRMDNEMVKVLISFALAFTGRRYSLVLTLLIWMTNRLRRMLRIVNCCNIGPGIRPA